MDSYIERVVSNARPYRYRYDPSKPPPPSVANIVTRVEFGCPIDLKKIVRHLPEVHYDPTRFAAVKARVGPPKSCALGFSSGLAVINGLSTIHQVEVACQKYGEILRSTGHPISTYTFTVQNAVMRAHIRGGLDLKRIHKDYMGYTVKKDNFPGLMFYPPGHRVTVTIFSSGRFNIVGLKTNTQGIEAYEYMMTILPYYKLHAKSLPKVRTLARRDTIQTSPRSDSEIDETIAQKTNKKKKSSIASKRKKTPNRTIEDTPKPNTDRPEDELPTAIVTKQTTTNMFDLRELPKKESEVRFVKLNHVNTSPNIKSTNRNKNAKSTTQNDEHRAILSRLRELSNQHVEDIDTTQNVGIDSVGTDNAKISTSEHDKHEEERKIKEKRAAARERMLRYSRKVMEERGTKHVVNLNQSLRSTVESHANPDELATITDARSLQNHAANSSLASLVNGVTVRSSSMALASIENRAEKSSSIESESTQNMTGARKRTLGFALFEEQRKMPSSAILHPSSSLQSDSGDKDNTNVEPATKRARQSINGEVVGTPITSSQLYNRHADLRFVHDNTITSALMNNRANKFQSMLNKASIMNNVTSSSMTNRQYDSDRQRTGLTNVLMSRQPRMSASSALLDRPDELRNNRESNVIVL